MVEVMAISPPYATRAGSHFPSDASASADGVNFSIFSRHATRVELLLYAADSPAPFQVIFLDPEARPMKNGSRPPMPSA